jgi:hypothetical protein
MLAPRGPKVVGLPQRAIRFCPSSLPGISHRVKLAHTGVKGKGTIIQGFSANGGKNHANGAAAAVRGGRAGSLPGI